ncbi:Cirhin [Tetrabaena socialis]|uniref:Cirhin n=1 Tax=Tetrabaena socialis TaxID=47790 RepID=A0A2J8ADN4_9CHLO|nr:Cirhin [Tetrabaena socialis]|eukprot:PNH10616.1 Cirhin [Tetrabaena socialis]
MATGKRGRPEKAAGGPAAGAQEDAAGPGPGSSSTTSGVVALHRSRMFDWKPSAVVAIAPCPGASLFAVGYECGSLELWDMHQLVCTQTVAGPSLELTSVAWARDTFNNSWRTFAAYLDGTVAEVVWRQAVVAHAVDSYGGVVWALAASPQSAVKPGFAHVLAAACDDGSVRLFGCEGGEPGLVFERVLARLQGRLLCCAWHAGGTALVVAGTSGNIHVLDAVTGHEQLRITAASTAVRPVTVWRVLSLPDGTLVSGDSDGATQMWDSRFGTLLQRFPQHRADVLALAALTGGLAAAAAAQHRADVLALAALEDGSSVFAAGVDSQWRVAGPGGRGG